MKKAFCVLTACLTIMVSSCNKEDTRDDMVTVEVEQFTDGGQYSGRLEKDNNSINNQNN